MKKHIWNVEPNTLYIGLYVKHERPENK